MRIDTDLKWCPICESYVEPKVTNATTVLDGAYGRDASFDEWDEECPDCGSEELTNMPNEDGGRDA